MQAVEYYSVLKNKWTIKLWGLMDETYVHITKWKKKTLKEAIYYMIPTIWCYGKGKTIEMIKKNVSGFCNSHLLFKTDQNQVPTEAFLASSRIDSNWCPHRTSAHSVFTTIYKTKRII